MQPLSNRSFQTTWVITEMFSLEIYVCKIVLWQCCIKCINCYVINEIF